MLPLMEDTKVDQFLNKIFSPVVPLSTQNQVVEMLDNTIHGNIY